MIWIYTGWNIALMTYEHSSRDFPNEQLIRNPMRTQRFSCHSDHSVPP